MSLTAVLRRVGRGDITMYGFRSTFRDWCSEAVGTLSRERHASMRSYAIAAKALNSANSAPRIIVESHSVTNQKYTVLLQPASRDIVAS